VLWRPQEAALDRVELGECEGGPFAPGGASQNCSAPDNFWSFDEAATTFSPVNDSTRCLDHVDIPTDPMTVKACEQGADGQSWKLEKEE
jgi:hypothetical protein